MQVTGMRWLATLMVALGYAVAVSPASAAHTRAALLLAADQARPGETVMAGVQLQMDPGWHTYWTNSGDSGMGTTLEWHLPAGVTAGEIQWPVPEKLTDAGLTTYVYHDEVVLLVPLSISADAKPGDLELKAKVAWLECEVMCVPGDQEVSARLSISPEGKQSANADLLAKWQQKVPQNAEGIDARAYWEKSDSGNLRSLVIEWKSAEASAPEFFPFAGPGYEVQGDTKVLTAENGTIRLRKAVKKLDGDWPQEIAGVVAGGKDPQRQAWKVALKPASGQGPAPAGNLAAAPSLWKMLLYAFLGGIILNIMPCVLPVIALKILGFVGQAKDSPARVRKLGLVYAGGVLVSFLVLAAIVIALQAAGQQAGWGMQFGNPYFLVALTVLVTLVALNLFGLFEVTPGGKVMGAAVNLTSTHGSSGAFFNGVLATVLATPCTAPFLGAAVGFAFIAQNAVTILLIFSFIALGLAFPYVLLSWKPGWLKYLPKPGPWMERFKIAMGFPLLGTAVWLFSLLPAHYGGRAWWVALFLVLLALAAWIFGEFIQRGTRNKGIAWAVILVILGSGYLYALESEMNWRRPLADTGTSAAVSPNKEGGIDWKPWSRQAVTDALSQGRPVFVDFTADWCLTCQANKKVAIEVPSVISKLKEINAVPLLGDYTRLPKDITEELRRFGRAGVPLVLVYPADASKAPIVLPEALIPGVVIGALDQASAVAK